MGIKSYCAGEKYLTEITGIEFPTSGEWRLEAFHFNRCLIRTTDGFHECAVASVYGPADSMDARILAGAKEAWEIISLLFRPGEVVLGEREYIQNKAERYLAKINGEINETA